MHDHCRLWISKLCVCVCVQPPAVQPQAHTHNWSVYVWWICVLYEQYVHTGISTCKSMNILGLQWD